MKLQGRSTAFLVAGAPDPGNPRAVPEHVVQSWVKEGLIEWLGHVEDMPTLLSTIHVMALPSYYGEGVPRSLIEAAASGLALVTTNAPGCREIVKDKIDGLLVPMRDAAALAAAIARLEDEPDLAYRLGVAAKKKAEGEFDQHTVLDQTLAVYATLLVPR
jgi:glycosyltransferase involved in cell wall biosynthesis